MTNDSAGYGRITNILLIEDNLEEARRIELMLDLTQDTYQLLTAVSVKTARHTLETEKIQIILLDLTLPDGEGVQTIRALHTSYPQIPIVVLIGLDSDQVVADAATAGAQDYLLKQEITPSDLWRVVRYALERHNQEEELRQSQRAYQRQALELHLLNRIISTASASQDEQTILDLACFELSHFYGALRTLFLFCQEHQAALALQAGDAQPGLPPLPQTLLDFKTAQQLTAVLITQQTLICPVLAENLQQFFAVPPNSRALAHPLNMAGETIGFCLVILPESYALAVRDAQLIGMVLEEVELGLTKVQLNGRLQAHANDLEIRVQERTQALAEANKQLTSLDTLKSKFVSDISHELRNPITNLSLYLELLGVSQGEKQTQYIGILRQQVRRLYSLVEDILTLSRLEHGNSNHLFQPLDLNYLTQQVVQVHTARAQNKKVRLSFKPTTPLPLAWGDSDQMTQVITNLVDNALNYTATGSIVLSTSTHQLADRAELLLKITDSGMGILEQDLPHIFERFYRGSQIDRKAMTGTGLGLGIVKEIVEKHNGRIQVSSTVNQGTTFTVFLPTAPKE
ncbi:MAG: response regulator [Anaerolineales bacterium]|nr:response regulator [Anaerolineales bacterium]